MRQVVEEFGIECVFHFTQAENLRSIFQHGIIPVSDHQQRGIVAKKNDLYRLDFCEGATSLSITFPNYKLFYRFRMNDQTVDWAVLALEPRLLWEKQCVFCTDNAANSNVSQQTLRERMGEGAFRQMFAEFPGKPPRSVLGISNNCPTNPQAEVLVFGPIEPQYIFAVCFEDKPTLDRYKDCIPSSIQKEAVKGLFSARKDYMHW